VACADRLARLGRPKKPKMRPSPCGTIRKNAKGDWSIRCELATTCRPHRAPPQDDEAEGVAPAPQPGNPEATGHFWMVVRSPQTERIGRMARSGPGLKGGRDDPAGIRLEWTLLPPSLAARMRSFQLQAIR